MSYALIPSNPDHAAASPLLLKSKRFTGKKGKGVFSMPNRNIVGLLEAMDYAGLLTPSEAPPGTYGQVAREKFETQADHHVTAAEATWIAQGLTDLLANEDDLEMVYDILDLDEDGAPQLEMLITEFVEFQKFAAASGGYTVS